MSFGYSAGDFVVAVQLAWRVLQNAKQACVAHDDLIQEVNNLHLVLRRLETEVGKHKSFTKRIGGNYKEELGGIVRTCERWLESLDGILEKYNALGEKKASAAKLWQRVKFGNGEMQDLSHIRLQLGNSYAAINVYLSLMSSSSQGRIEQMIKKQGGTLAGMLPLLNGIAGSLAARTEDGTVITAYSNDDTSVWREFRRELRSEGFTSTTIAKHKITIKAYIKELGDRGVLDGTDVDGLEQKDIAKRQLPYIEENHSEEESDVEDEEDMLGAEFDSQSSSGESEESDEAHTQINRLSHKRHSLAIRDGGGQRRAKYRLDPSEAFTDYVVNINHSRRPYTGFSTNEDVHTKSTGFNASLRHDVSNSSSLGVADRPIKRPPFRGHQNSKPIKYRSSAFIRPTPLKVRDSQHMGTQKDPQEGREDIEARTAQEEAEEMTDDAHEDLDSASIHQADTNDLERHFLFSSPANSKALNPDSTLDDPGSSNIFSRGKTALKVMGLSPWLNRKSLKPTSTLARDVPMDHGANRASFDLGCTGCGQLFGSKYSPSRAAFKFSCGRRLCPFCLSVLFQYHITTQRYNSSPPKPCKGYVPWHGRPHDMDHGHPSDCCSRSIIEFRKFKRWLPPRLKTEWEDWIEESQTPYCQDCRRPAYQMKLKGKHQGQTDKWKCKCGSREIDGRWF